MIGHKLDNSSALKFIFAGNSSSTFINSSTQNRFTYSVRQKKDSSIFFVSVLTSPDIYTYIGLVIEGQFIHGKKSVISSGAQSVKVFNYVIERLKANRLPDFVEVWHEGRCGKCGRKLTVPTSIANGIGPECINSISKSEKRDKFLELVLA